MITTGAVLHGDPAAPCVAAWEAHAIGRAPVGAIVPGDLAQAWLFRALPRGQAGASAVEARPMSCRFDPATKIPDALWSEPATLRVAP